MKKLVIFSFLFIGIFYSSKSQTFEQVYSQAEDSIENYNYSAGYFYANQCVKMEPNRDNSYTLRAYASSTLWNHLEAYKDAERALHINPKNTYAHYLCGMANIHIPISQYEQDSILNIFKIGKKDSMRGILLNYKIPSGTLENYFYNYGKSFEHFSKAFELDSTYYENLYLIGYYYSELNHLDSALNYLNKAIALDPNESKYYVARGLVYKQKYMSKSSLADFDKSIELDSTNGVAYSNRAYLKKEQFNDQAGSCEDLKKAQRFGSYTRSYYIECE